MLCLQASFGSLIGFLPYRNLAARWKFIAFESWLRRKGLDPSNYRQNLGVIGAYEPTRTSSTSETQVTSEIGIKEDSTITPVMKLEDLLIIYDQEKLKFLSSFVGQVWMTRFEITKKKKKSWNGGTLTSILNAHRKSKWVLY